MLIVYRKLRVNFSRDTTMTIENYHFCHVLTLFSSSLSLVQYYIHPVWTLTLFIPLLEHLIHYSSCLWFLFILNHTIILCSYVPWCLHPYQTVGLIEWDIFPFHGCPWYIKADFLNSKLKVSGISFNDHLSVNKRFIYLNRTGIAFKSCFLFT